MQLNNLEQNYIDARRDQRWGEVQTFADAIYARDTNRLAEIDIRLKLHEEGILADPRDDNAITQVLSEILTNAPHRLPTRQAIAHGVSRYMAALSIMLDYATDIDSPSR